MTWYLDEGNECDVVLSSRVRLARNLKAYKFPHLLAPAEAEKLVGEVKSALTDGGDSRQMLELKLDELTAVDRLALMEKNLISRAMAAGKGGQYLFIRDDEALSLMVNEEDHLRIQAMSPGFDLLSCFKQARQLANYLEQVLDLAKDPEFGYLTACPTNTGTGLRASVMVHLPGLEATGYWRKIRDTLTKSGFTVRGNLGEGSESKGQVYQISNNVTLGLSDVQLVKRLVEVVTALIKQERQARQALVKENRIGLEDEVMRALGILTYAKILTSSEANSLLSLVSLGKDLGFIDHISYRQLNQARYSIGPASVQKLCKQELSARDRDAARAKLLGEILRTQATATQ